MSYNETLGKAFLGEEHYNSLLNFLMQIWENTPRFRYRVFMPRRCFNLNQIFMDIANAEDGTYDLCGVISTNALMRESAAIAHEYLETGVIPPILLVDDIIVHGRAIQKLLLDLEDEIRAVLLKEENYREDSLIRELHWNLAKAVRIRVYLANDEPFLLEDEYLYRLSSEHSVDRKTWQELSQRVSWFIQNSSVVNTSFVLSASTVKKSVIETTCPTWKKVKWDLRERSEEFYFYKLKKAAEDDESIIFSVRTYYTIDAKGVTRKHYIPFVFAQKDYYLRKPMAAYELEMLIKNSFPAEIGSVLSACIKGTVPQKQRIQFFYLVFSAVVLNRFTKATADYSVVPFQYDVHKICRNFGTSIHLQTALEEMLRNDNFLSQCEQLMLKWLEGYSDVEFELFEYQLEQVSSKPDPQIRYQLNRKVEDRMFANGMEAEREAAFLIQENRAFYPGPKSSDTCSFNEALMCPELADFPIYYRLCCLLMLMDAGVVSFGPECSSTNNETDDGLRFELILRAGEQALFCKPRQLALYMPAMIKIEHRYLQQSKQAVYEKIEAFQEYLKTHTKYAPSGLREFTEEWYSVGKKLNVWDINLLYSMETEEEDYNHHRFQRITQMIKQQDEIRSLCTEYLGS